MKVQRILQQAGRRPVETIAADQLVGDAVEQLGAARVRSLVVVEGEKAAGILTVRDLLRFLAKTGGEGMKRGVQEAMTGDLATVSPSAELEEARDVLIERQVNHVPVVDGDGKLLGIVTMADVLAANLEDVRQFNENLQHYIHGHYAK